MHISQIQEAAGLVSMMYKAIPVKSMCWGRADTFSEAGKGISRCIIFIKALGYWTEGSEVLYQSLTEVSAQSG